MVNTVWVNADCGCNFHSLADDMTKLQIFTKEENRDFSAFQLSPQLMLEQALISLIVCLMISQKLYTKVAQMSSCCSGYQVGLVFRKIYLK